MKKSNFFLLFMLSISIANSSATFAAPRIQNSQDQHSPLCIDLARRIITTKVSYYQNFKKNKKSFRNTASTMKFESLPPVVSPRVDKKVISLILQSHKEKKMAKNFTQKLNAEDRLISNMSKVMKTEGKNFMNQCVNLYKSAEQKCDAYISKDFNKFTNCLSTITNEQGLAVSKFVPFVNYTIKARSVASRQKR